MSHQISKKTLEALNAQLRSRNVDGLLQLTARIQIDNPNSLISRLYTARGLMLTRKYAEASDILETIVLPFPRFKKIFLDYLKCLNLAGRKLQWEVQAQRFLEYHFSEKVILGLARRYFKTKLWEQAHQLLARLLAGTKQAQYWEKKLALPLGRVFFEMGNFKEALKFLEISGSDSSLFLQARIYSGMGQMGKAHSLIAHVSDKNHPRIAKFRLSLARKSGNQESEIQALEELLNHHCSPKDRALQLYRLGNLYCKAQDYDRAVRIFHSLQALVPANLKILGLRIHCLEQAGSFSKAFELCLKFHRRSPFHVNNLRTGVRLALNLDKSDQAYSLLKGAWLCGIKDTGLRIQLAELCLKRLDCKEAKRVLEGVLEESGADSRVYGLMATAWELEGNIRISTYYRELMRKFSVSSAA